MKIFHSSTLGTKAFHLLCAFVLVSGCFNLGPAAAQAPAPMSTTLYVDVDATGANDGNSWENAFTTLQPALEQAAAGDQVWVAAGTYYPTVEHCGSGDLHYQSFQLKNGVGVYGGFDPSTGDVGWDDRDWVVNGTTLSGDIGTPGDNSDNSYHVFCHPEGLNLDSTAILDGFTITGGTGEIDPYSEGGGMFNDLSSPALVNIIFTDNAAALGGGMMNVGTSPVLTNVIFNDNESWYEGGGMYNYFSSPSLNNVTFSNNIAGMDGGGMRNNNSSPTLTNVTFSENSATQYGGGMYNWNSSPHLTNVTFSRNLGLLGGGIYNGNYSNPTLVNSILWGDTHGEIFNFGTSSPLVTYSDIQGGYPGEGNKDADPLFLDAANGDLHLWQYSPAIDAGDNTAPGLVGVTIDLDGNPRFIDNPNVTDTGNGTPPIVDMGAYELQTVIPQVIYVDFDASGANDGASWEDAFTTLQPALELAAPGYQVWVATGTYTPTVENCGTGDPRFQSFQLKNGVGVYGGFDPSSGDINWEDRDWPTNSTILSGDIGTPGDPSDNSYHVFCHPQGLNLDSSAVINGFSITGGNANGPDFKGGGMYNEGSSPTLVNLIFSGNLVVAMYNSNSSPCLTNVTFSGNTQAINGAGMYNSNSNPTLNRATFADNSADYNGGGMYNDNSNPTLLDVTFSNNVVGLGSQPGTGLGAGMFNSSSSPTLSDVTFLQNGALHSGGGMYNSLASSPLLYKVIFDANTTQDGPGAGVYNDAASPRLINVTFSSNSAYQDGGGMFNLNSSPTLLDVTFAGNRSQSSGGGGMYNSASSPSLVNVTFSGNIASADGGGLSNNLSSPVLLNVTFSNNSAASGGGMHNLDSSPTIMNSILWGDAPDEIFNEGNSGPLVTYSDVLGGFPGEGNIDLDPLLQPLADNGGFVLTQALPSGSPAVDTGNPDPATCPATDARRLPRPSDGDGDGIARCDMGAYELQLVPLVRVGFLPLVSK